MAEFMNLDGAAPMARPREVMRRPSNQQNFRDQARIPLICTICPKNSKFSDISHLLTHVSSKGHLHNQFQLTILKDSDPEARRVLQTYEDWFRVHNIATLIRDRMTTRDQKRVLQRGSQFKRAGSCGRGGIVKGNKAGRGGRRNAVCLTN
jgi:hypothetical protein